jgi:methionine-rich copper-binding protein CopC
MRKRASRYGTLISIVIALTVPVSPAWGHAALQDSDPGQGARLDAVPPSVIVTYAEPPTNASVFHVFDGCNSDVASDVTVLNDTIEATTDAGQPGRWRVEWRVISAVDGHLTTDAVTFRGAAGPHSTHQATHQPAQEPRQNSGITHVTK